MTRRLEAAGDGTVERAAQERYEQAPKALLVDEPRALGVELLDHETLFPD